VFGAHIMSISHLVYSDFQRSEQCERKDSEGSQKLLESGLDEMGEKEDILVPTIHYREWERGGWWGSFSGKKSAGEREYAWKRARTLEHMGGLGKTVSGGI